MLGIRPTEPIRIVSYSNYRDMSRALPFRSQAVRQDLQTEGMAFPVERVLMVLASETNVTGIASHEFTHILVAEAAGEGYGRVPAWLNEGLAEYGNIDQTPQYDWALRYAVFTRRLKPLWYLQTLGGDPDDITIGYGHGKSVVEYLAIRYGEEKLAELMRAFADTRNLSADDALRATYEFDQYGLDTEWRQSHGLEPFPPPGDLERRLVGDAADEGDEEEQLAPEPTPQLEATPAAPPDDDAEELPAAEEPRRDRSELQRSLQRGCDGPGDAGTPCRAYAGPGRPLGPRKVKDRQHGGKASQAVAPRLVPPDQRCSTERSKLPTQHLSHLVCPRVEGVADRISQQVEGEDQDGDDSNREQQQVGIAAEDSYVAVLEQHPAQVRRGWLNPNPQPA